MSFKTFIRTYTQYTNPMHNGITITMRTYSTGEPHNISLEVEAVQNKTKQNDKAAGTCQIDIDMLTAFRNPNMIPMLATRLFSEYL